MVATPCVGIWGFQTAGLCFFYSLNGEKEDKRKASKIVASRILSASTQTNFDLGWRVPANNLESNKQICVKSVQSFQLNSLVSCLHLMRTLLLDIYQLDSFLVFYASGHQGTLLTGAVCRNYCLFCFFTLKQNTSNSLS